MCGLIFDIVDIAVMGGVFLERWKLVHQVLLLKDPPAAHVDSFHNIALIEADLMICGEKSMGWATSEKN